MQPTSLPPAPAAPMAAAGKVAATKVGGALALKLAGLAGLIGLGIVGYGQLTATKPAPSPAITESAQPLQPVSPPVLVPTVVPLEEAAAPSEPIVAKAPPQPATKAKPRLKRARRVVPAPQLEKPSELSLMDEAQKLRAQPRQMLQVLQRHANLYPSGMLAQEREVLRVEALVKLGRRGEAERVADALERAHPGSPHLRRVRALLQPEDAAN